MPSNEGNGKVTHAELKKDIEYLIKSFDNAAQETRANRERTDERMRAAEKEIVCLYAGLNNAKDDIKEIRSHSNRWDAIVGAGALIGAFISGLIGTNR